MLAQPNFGRLGAVGYRSLAAAVRALFANNEQGAWYDPQDYGTSGFNGVGTLYQDSAGTTLCSAVEQPVGLMLDKRKGLVLGSELLTTPLSISGAGWSVVGSTFVASSSTATGVLAASTTLATTKRYKVSFTASSLSGSTCFLTLDSTVASLTKRIATAKDYSFILLGNGAPNIQFQPYEGTAFSVTISNLTIKELEGNHAYQSTSAARPTLRARHNQLTYSEQFDNAAYTRTNLNVTPNAVTAPDGTLTADKLVETAISGQHTFQQSVTVTASGYTWSIRAKAAERRRITLRFGGIAPADSSTFDLVSGTVVTGSGTITALGDGWYRCALASTASTSGARTHQLYLNTDSGNGTETYLGDGTSGVYVHGADVRDSNLATGLIPLYQRIAAATDYDTVGFPIYIQGNGSSQFMLTSAIDFSGTDKMTVWAGVRKLSDAAQSCVAAIGLNGGTPSVNPEQGLLLAPGAAAATTYYWRATGSLTPTAATATGYTSPHSAVLAAQAEIATDLQSLRVNGAAAVLGSGDIGTGNFGSGQIIYLLARGGTTLWFGGYFYGAIIRGAASDEGQIQAGEKYLNNRARVY